MNDSGTMLIDELGSTRLRWFNAMDAKYGNRSGSRLNISASADAKIPNCRRLPNHHPLTDNDR